MLRSRGTGGRRWNRRRRRTVVGDERVGGEGVDAGAVGLGRAGVHERAAWQGWKRRALQRWSWRVRVRCACRMRRSGRQGCIDSTWRRRRRMGRYREELRQATCSQLGSGQTGLCPQHPTVGHLWWAVVFGKVCRRLPSFREGSGWSTGSGTLNGNVVVIVGRILRTSVGCAGGHTGC